MAGLVDIRLALHRHPDSAGPSLAAAARIRRTPQGTLTLTYTLEGELASVALPEPRPGRVGERLWEHTCFELFMARSGMPGYLELNFAPSGEWAAYAFAGYRAPVAFSAERHAPRIAVRNGERRFELEAVLELASVSPAHAGAKLSMAISAVIESRDGALSYWALKHPSGRPDFHHPDSFVLSLG